MKLELDKRIGTLSDVFNFSDVENAKQFIEQKGYFTNCIYFFKNIQLCKYGTLINVFTGSFSYNVFRRKEDGAYWEYFIPESFLKSKEKKYIPFTLNEFLFRFNIGNNIIFRSKIDRYDNYNAVFNGYETNKNLTEIFLGVRTYSFQDLFDNFELCVKGEWFPFGVEVKE